MINWGKKNNWFKFILPEKVVPQSEVDTSRNGVSITRQVSSQSEVLRSQGNALLSNGKLDDAASLFRQAISLNPHYAEAYTNLGIVSQMLGDLAEAVILYRKAVGFKPDLIPARLNLATCLLKFGQLDAAEESLKRVVELAPEHATCMQQAAGLQGLGIIATQRGDFFLAETLLRRALDLVPDDAEAHNNLGHLLSIVNRLPEAEGAYRRALELQPDLAEAYSNLLFSMTYTSTNATHYLEEARRYGLMMTRKANIHFSSWYCADNPKRLRVGLVSGDLREHAVGFFLEGMLSHLDPVRIELFAYPTTSIEDELSARIRPYFSAWKPLVGKSDGVSANLIREDGVHVLLDISGHSGHNRLPVFAWKPAPMQASWLGYLASTGLTEIDYFLGDKWTLPSDEEHHFVEKIWRLSGVQSCMTPPKEAVKIEELPALRNNVITFGTLNNLNKMNARVVACWAGILNAVPNSRLYLSTRNLRDGAFRNNIIAQYAAHGIPENRLVLESTAGRYAALNSYNQIDIALDTFPYPGCTTSYEALWMGVPILTMQGNNCLSHMGESILQNAGLPDWIATDEKEYIAKAIEKASDISKLASLRESLRELVLASPLFDTISFARDFEDALWGMFEHSAIQRTESINHLAINESMALRDQGNALLNNGKLEDAATCFKQAIALNPHYAEAYTNLGIVFQTQGNPGEATALYQKAIEFKPNLIAAHLNLATCLMHLGQIDAAEESLRRVLGLAPEHATVEQHVAALQRLSLIVSQRGDFSQTESLLQRALELLPDNADIHNNLGILLLNIKRLAEAEKLFRRTLELKPDHAEASYNLGVTLMETNSLSEAETAFRRALKLRPEYVEAYIYLGNLFMKVARMNEAEVAIRNAIKLKPDFAEVHSNLGVLLLQTNCLPEAEASCRRAVELKPEYADAHNHLAFAMLKLGDMKNGWEEYEWRHLSSPLIKVRRNFTQPQWRGEEARGKTLLIYAEQGFGDTLQFCRYASLASTLGLRIVLEVPKQLVRLLNSLNGIDSVIEEGKELPPFDLHCPMLSLPFAFKTTLATIPCSASYLHAGKTQVDFWQERLANLPNRGYRIGLVWSGNPRAFFPDSAAIDQRRSMPFEQLTPLFDLQGLHFFNLQKDGSTIVKNYPLTDFMDEMEDFADTAALISNLDLVISVDTAVVHLAAALGKPVWVLDRFDSCWRWLMNRDDSPWYPSLRLFRQPDPGNWQAVVERVSEELRLLKGMLC